jgi:CDP-paratose 2-epimerase
MKLLITGGCGFLGSNLAAEAIKRKDDLYIFDDLSRLGSENNLSWLKTQGEFNFIKGDIRAPGKVNELISSIRPDAVFHLAGQVAMTTSLADPRKDFEINALGTFNLLEAVKNYCPDSIILYSSTNKVYGDLEWVDYEETETRYIGKQFPNGFDEKIPLSFSSPYGCSKGSADQYILDFYRMFGIKAAVFRHSSMYGGQQYSTYDQGWIGWFCEQAIKTKLGKLDKPFTISGNGKQVRDVLYCDDMVNLYFKALKNIENIKGKAFNIGGGMENSLSLLELFLFLEKELDIKLNFITLPPRESDQKVFVADISKAKNLIGWEPKIDKISGIKKMLEWVSGLNK